MKDILYILTKIYEELKGIRTTLNGVVNDTTHINPTPLPLGKLNTLDSEHNQS
jgi:hypothetical protein